MKNILVIGASIVGICIGIELIKNNKNMKVIKWVTKKKFGNL